jgi:anti-sigma regulatory factor (Ser/Thr protein kinase)
MDDIQPNGNTIRLAFSYPAVPDAIGDLRRLILNEAGTAAFTDEQLDDLALAVSEAITNIVQYAPGHHIRGVCEVDDRKLVLRLEVEPTIGQYLERAEFPTGLSHSGRGIPLLRLLIPTVEVYHRADGVTELHLVKPVQETEECNEKATGH